MPCWHGTRPAPASAGRSVAARTRRACRDRFSSGAAPTLSRSRRLLSGPRPEQVGGVCLSARQLKLPLQALRAVRCHLARELQAACVPDPAALRPGPAGPGTRLLEGLPACLPALPHPQEVQICTYLQLCMQGLHARVWSLLKSSVFFRDSD